MKAVRLLEYGGKLASADVPTPTIARDEILVKIKSTAVNHLDLVEASGTARQILPIDLPWIPGHEFSGVVEQIGSDVAAFAAGDAVFGVTTGMGAYAEYVAVKATAIAKKPSNLSFEEAASVPVAAGAGLCDQAMTVGNVTAATAIIAAPASVALSIVVSPM